MKLIEALALFTMVLLIPPYLIEAAWAFITWTTPSANPGDWHAAVRVLSLIWVLWWFLNVARATKNAMA